MRSLIVLAGSFSMLVAQEAKVDFVRQVAPILIQRCVECHGAKEQEGELRLDRREYVFVDGKQDEWVVHPGKPDDSEFLRRVLLPASDDDVMPAEGEPLRKEQIDVLRQWIAEGADWPAAGDQVFIAAEEALEKSRIKFELPVVDDAAKAKIEAALTALRARGAVAQRVAADTDAVDVNFSLLREQVGDQDLAALADLAPVLVWLNLSRTAVTDAGLERLAGLTELRRLHLAGTAVGDAGVRHLQGLGKLDYLNLYGSKVGDAGLAALGGLVALRKLFVWETPVTEAGAKALADKLPALQIDRGEYVAARLQAAEQEIADRQARNKPANTVCPVSDKPVDPAHAIDHDGIRLGFCCAKCLAAFQKDAAPYAAKVAQIKAAAAAAQKPVNDTCPVNGKPVDLAHTVEHDGKRIAFCCGNCLAKFVADPASYADKLPK